jgi:PAS domain S-box-containing protein
MPEIQLTPLLLPFVVSVILTASLTVYGVKQLQKSRHDKTALTFTSIVAFVTLWTVARFGELLFVDQTITKAWITLLYVGYGIGAPSILFFALAFTGRDHLLTWQNVVMILIIPILAVLVAGTNDAHHLFWTGEFVDIDGLSVYQREFKPVFFGYLLYQFGLFLVGAYILLRMAITSADVYRRQTFAFMIGCLVPFIVGTLYTIDAIPGVPTFFDPTPIGFAFASLCFGYGIRRHSMLDLVPIARDTVIESMRDGYVVVDSKNRIVDLNDSARALFETETEVIGKTIESTLPECHPLIEDHEHGTRDEDEITVERDGEQRFLLANISSLTHNEQTIGRLLLLRDVTEQRAVQRRYQALIENSSDIILVTETDGTIRYASPSITNVMGVDPDAVIGESCFDLVDEDDRRSLETGFETITEDPDATVRSEYRSTDADGNERVLEGVARNMLDNPYVEGIVVNAREITERKKRERELEETNKELTDANQRLEQFASVISHDLRNPINVAKGHVGLARERGDEQHFEKIEESLSRMEAIIQDVLTLAREGESIGETESVRLEEIASEAWEHVATDEATLVVAEDGEFEADSDRLLQLLENLFRNAEEHGSDDVTVTVGLNWDTIYVGDDGPGVPPDKRDEVLESGYTTNEGGTGLGLSIVSQIAEAHGWDVSVTESADGGAQFEFSGVERPR